MILSLNNVLFPWPHYGGDPTPRCRTQITCGLSDFFSSLPSTIVLSLGFLEDSVFSKENPSLPLPVDICDAIFSIKNPLGGVPELGLIINIFARLLSSSAVSLTSSFKLLLLLGITVL